MRQLLGCSDICIASGRMGADLNTHRLTLYVPRFVDLATVRRNLTCHLQATEVTHGVLSSYQAPYLDTCCRSALLAIASYVVAV